MSMAYTKITDLTINSGTLTRCVNEQNLAGDANEQSRTDDAAAKDIASKIEVLGLIFVADLLGDPNCQLASLAYLYSNPSVSELKKLACALRDNTTLHSLDFGWSNIDDEGVKILAPVLEVNSTLTELVLNKNHIGVSGALALASSLEQNVGLTKLDTIDNGGTRLGAGYLILPLERNTSLRDLRGDDNYFDMGKNIDDLQASAVKNKNRYKLFDQSTFSLTNDPEDLRDYPLNRRS